MPTSEPKFGIVPPTSDRDEELLAELGEGADLVDQGALGLGQGLEGDGPAAAAEERLHQAQGQERLHGRLDRVLADEVEHDLVGEAGDELGAGVEDLADAGDRPHVQMPRSASRSRGSGRGTG